jgi:long-subunit acyl-CoA synthetase (AMP-forming)
VPPNHPTGILHCDIMPWFFGMTLVMMPVCDRNDYCHYLYHMNIQVGMVPLSYFSNMLTCNLPDGALSHMKWAMCGGEPVTKEAALATNAAMKRLGVQNPYLCIAYGMSEAGPVVCQSQWLPHLINKCGPALRGFRARVVDDDGREVPDNTRGHIQLKAPCHMKGYFKEPELTKELYTEDGFIKTGDIAVCDENGYFDVLGRASDVITTPDGEKIYMFDIERIVYEEKAVLENEVIALEIEGQKRPVVHIVPYPEYESKIEEVLQNVNNLCKKKLKASEMPYAYKIQKVFEINPVSQKRNYQKLSQERDGFYIVTAKSLQCVNF